MTLQTIDSEVVYDLIQDHLDVLLTLLEGPKSRETTVKLLGGEATLGRFHQTRLTQMQRRWDRLSDN